MTEPVRRPVSLNDGTMSCLEWASDRPLLLFLHATGFNAETYRGLLGPLAEHFHIIAPDQRGHGMSKLPLRPDAVGNWEIYCDDLLALLDRQPGRPALLAGHSMGATVALLGAARSPGRASGLVLVEPVLPLPMHRLRRGIRRLMGSVEPPGLAERAARRRAHFPSADAALQSYGGRGAFRTWPQETVADYLRGGLIEDPVNGGVTLACAPAWEAATFRAAPLARAHLAASVRSPIAVLRGTVGSTCADGQAALLRRAGAHDVTVHGASHFLPMENPDLVRHEILRLAAAGSRQA
jgi:pimeloyl-ACP methyl ester carboxylesterase